MRRLNGIALTISIAMAAVSTFLLITVPRPS